MPRRHPPQAVEQAHSFRVSRIVANATASRSRRVGQPRNRVASTRLAAQMDDQIEAGKFGGRAAARAHSQAGDPHWELPSNTSSPCRNSADVAWVLVSENDRDLSRQIRCNRSACLNWFKILWMVDYETGKPLSRACANSISALTCRSPQAKRNSLKITRCCVGRSLALSNASFQPASEHCRLNGLRSHPPAPRRSQRDPLVIHWKSGQPTIHPMSLTLGRCRPRPGEPPATERRADSRRSCSRRLHHQSRG